MESRSPRIQELEDLVHISDDSDPSGGMLPRLSSLSNSEGQCVTHSLERPPNGVDAPQAKPAEAKLKARGRRGSTLEEISRQGSVIFGFGDSDDSTEDSEYYEVQGEEERYIGSTGSELGESDTYSTSDHDQT